MATLGFGSAVVNKAGAYLDVGKEGGEQSLVFGNTSLEERYLPSREPPVKRATVSSRTGGASVAGPADLLL